MLHIEHIFNVLREGHQDISIITLNQLHFFKDVTFNYPR